LYDQISVVLKHIMQCNTMEIKRRRPDGLYLIHLNTNR